MSTDTTADNKNTNVVSARVSALILGSPRLRQQLQPEGPCMSPYEILDYRATLVLHDRDGRKATFQRTQRVKFLQDGVEAILDHFWCAGVLLTDYSQTAGEIGETFKDEGRRHVLIRLPRPMRKGEELTFSIRRTAMEAFTRAHEALETEIDHPLRRLDIGVVFPKARPCQQARLHIRAKTNPVAIRCLPDGSTCARIRIAQAKAHTPYTIRWSW